MLARKRVERRNTQGKLISDVLPAIHYTPCTPKQSWFRILVDARSPAEALTGLYLVRLATEGRLDITWQTALLLAPGQKPSGHLIAEGTDRTGRHCRLCVFGLMSGSDQPEVWQTAMALESIGFGLTDRIYDTIRYAAFMHTFTR